jgi:hypothetical protein
VGAVFEDALHIKVGGKEIALPAQDFTMTRQGQPVEYDEGCSVLPQPKDHLSATYQDPTSGTKVTLELDLLEQYALKRVERMGLPDELQRVILTTAQDCQGLAESRLFLKGTLTLSTKKNAPQKVPLLVQVIYLKD